MCGMSAPGGLGIGLGTGSGAGAGCRIAATCAKYEGHGKYRPGSVWVVSPGKARVKSWCPANPECPACNPAGVSLTSGMPHREHQVAAWCAERASILVENGVRHHDVVIEA